MKMGLKILTLTWFTSYQTMQNSPAFQPRGLMQNFCKMSTGWYRYLRMVELRQPGSTESLRQLTLDDNIVDIMSQQTMIDIARHGRFIHRKCSQSSLNATSRHASHDQCIVTVTTLITITTEALSAIKRPQNPKEILTFMSHELLCCIIPHSQEWTAGWSDNTINLCYLQWLTSICHELSLCN